MEMETLGCGHAKIWLIKCGPDLAGLVPETITHSKQNQVHKSVLM